MKNHLQGKLDLENMFFYSSYKHTLRMVHHNYHIDNISMRILYDCMHSLKLLENKILIFSLLSFVFLYNYAL